MTIAGDIRSALRSLRLRPGWSAAVILTFALGIGVNASMFTLVDRLLVRPPPHVRDPRRVVRLSLNQANRGGGRFTMSTTSYPVFADLRRDTRSFAALAAVSSREMVLGVAADARAVQAAQVSGAYFALLGSRPVLGRYFGEAEDRPAGDPVAVISHALWRHEFGASRSTLGRAVTLDGVRYVVIGVAPPDFAGDDVAPIDVWVPLHVALGAGAWTDSRGMNVVRILGRLRDGVTPAAAAEEGSLVVRRGMEGQPGADATVRVLLTSVAPGWADRGETTAQSGVALWVAAMSVVVLLIAIVNVANLMLLRSGGRRRERAVRLALGASPADLARAVLVDGLVLAALGGVAAVFVAAWSSESIRALLLPDLAGAEHLLSWRLIAIAGCGTLVAGVLAGLVPALRVTGASPVEDLKGGHQGRRRTRAPAALLVAQSGLCMVLLVAASLFVLSLHRVRAQDFGFRSAGVLLATLRFDGPQDGPAQDAVYREAEHAVSRLPGVKLASIVQAVPFAGHNVPPIAVPGHEDFPDMGQQAPFMVATTPTYFRVLGMRLLEGREFTTADRAGAPLVLIVNQAMAQGVWPGESAIGKCVRVGFVPGELPTGLHASASLPCRFVVGVINNARPRSIREEAGQARMQYYVPFEQLPPPFFAAAAPQVQGLLVRTVDGAALARPVQRMLQSFTSEVQLADVRPLQDLLDRQMRPWLLGAALFSAFGLLALGLAGIGVYGVRAHSVTQRTQEIGIRMSLGAGTDAVVRMVLWEGLRVTLIGIGLGIGVALAMGRMIEPLLFQTRARDPVAFAAIGVTLLLVAVAASALPAWRAARVDPNVALRAE